jgi:hypothetical protein
MEISKTRSQLIHETADKLNIVATGQPLDAEYFYKIDGNVDPLLLQLSADDICSVGDDAAIPGEWFDPLAGLLANVCAPMAGKSFDPQVKEYYESRLRRLTASGPHYSTLEVDYY